MLPFQLDDGIEQVAIISENDYDLNEHGVWNSTASSRITFQAHSGTMRADYSGLRQQLSAGKLGFGAH